jgi:hypothetical protein
MRWKYFIPHVWNRTRQAWEDIYLLPADELYKGQALWLTVDALGDRTNVEHGTDREEFQVEALKKLGDRPYLIDGADMIVRSADFSMDELLDWVRIWLRENRLTVTDLVEASVEEFSGKAFHADLMLRTPET